MDTPENPERAYSMAMLTAKILSAFALMLAVATITWIMLLIIQH